MNPLLPLLKYNALRSPSDRWAIRDQFAQEMEAFERTNTVHEVPGFTRIKPIPLRRSNAGLSNCYRRNQRKNPAYSSRTGFRGVKALKVIEHISGGRGQSLTPKDVADAIKAKHGLIVSWSFIRRLARRAAMPLKGTCQINSGNSGNDAAEKVISP